MPIATGKVLGVFVPNAETGLIVQVSLAVDGQQRRRRRLHAAAELSILLRWRAGSRPRLQPAVWDRLLRLPTKFFTERSTGELASAAMGISAIRRVLVRHRPGGRAGVHASVR